MKTVHTEYKKAVIGKLQGISDRGIEGLTAWADAFTAAHERAPGGLTIEIGTRVGGSAFLWAVLLDEMYEGKPPPLWTVDPYGSKPYVGGDGPPAPIYDIEMYSTMKQNMLVVKNHSHWLMTSQDFFARLSGVSYWWPGERMQMVQTATLTKFAPRRKVLDQCAALAIVTRQSSRRALSNR